MEGILPDGAEGLLTHRLRRKSHGYGVVQVVFPQHPGGKGHPGGEVLFCPSQHLPEQPVVVAVPVDISVAPGVKPGLGVTLPPLEAEEPDEAHRLIRESFDGEYFFSVPHEMRKDHFISFMAYVTTGRFDLVKLMRRASRRRLTAAPVI